MSYKKSIRIPSIKICELDLIVYDFDGVMTDNRALVNEEGEESVFINRGDGLAIQEIKNLGIEQIIISTEEKPIVQKRADKLGLFALHGIKDKKLELFKFCKKKKLNLLRVAYIGNDINDLEVMQEVGFPITPNDGEMHIKEIAKIITKKNGGFGVIRELLDLLEK